MVNLPWLKNVNDMWWVAAVWLWFLRERGSVDYGGQLWFGFVVSAIKGGGSFVINLFIINFQSFNNLQIFSIIFMEIRCPRYVKKYVQY